MLRDSWRKIQPSEVALPNRFAFQFSTQKHSSLNYKISRKSFTSLFNIQFNIPKVVGIYQERKNSLSYSVYSFLLQRIQCRLRREFIIKNWRRIFQNHWRNIPRIVVIIKSQCGGMLENGKTDVELQMR